MPHGLCSRRCCSSASCCRCRKAAPSPRLARSSCMAQQDAELSVPINPRHSVQLLLLQLCRALPLQECCPVSQRGQTLPYRAGD